MNYVPKEKKTHSQENNKNKRQQKLDKFNQVQIQDPRETWSTWSYNPYQQRKISRNQTQTPSWRWQMWPYWNVVNKKLGHSNNFTMSFTLLLKIFSLKNCYWLNPFLKEILISVKSDFNFGIQLIFNGYCYYYH